MYYLKHEHVGNVLLRSEAKAERFVSNIKSIDCECFEQDLMKDLEWLKNDPSL